MANDVAQQVKRLVREAGGIMQLAEAKGIPRQTVYNLLKGSWPSYKTAAILELRIDLSKNS